PLAEAQAILLAARRMAMRAGDAGLVERRGDLFRGQRMAAGAAELVLALFQAVQNGDALVEDEAGAFPEAVLRRHLFEIFQDAALEMVDLVEALLLHEGGRLLAADAAGAVHGDLRLVVQAGIAPHPVRELAECLRVRIDRAL